MKYDQAFITIATGDLSSLVEFYSRLLRQKPDPYQSGIYAEFSLNGLKLGIFSPKENHRQEFIASRRGAWSICLEVEDLGETIDYLRTIDCPHQPEISIASHGKETYIYDPDGNRLILYQPFKPQKPKS